MRGRIRKKGDEEEGKYLKDARKFTATQEIQQHEKQRGEERRHWSKSPLLKKRQRHSSADPQTKTNEDKELAREG